jgi:hypothetical protein
MAEGGKGTHHASGGVHNAHVLENRRSVVGNDNLTLRRLDHLVHSPRTKRCSDSIGDGYGAIRGGGEGRKGVNFA